MFPSAHVAFHAVVYVGKVYSGTGGLSSYDVYFLRCTIEILNSTECTITVKMVSLFLL